MSTHTTHDTVDDTTASPLPADDVTPVPSRGRSDRRPPEMSDEEADRLRAMSSDDPIPTPPGRVACASCGVATTPPPSRAAATIVEVPTYSPSGREVATARVTLGLCEACTERAHRVLTLVASHPALTRALGQHRAVEAAEGVLMVLDILGLAPPPIDVDDKRLGILVRNLANVGLGLRWSLHIRTAHLIDRANRHPWAHVRASDRQRLSAGRVHAFADRLLLDRGPVKIAPPAFTTDDLIPGRHPVAGGCGMCGVKHVEMSPERAAQARRRGPLDRQVWTLHMSVGTGSLGGARSPMQLTIWLCPSCEDAVQWEGAIGPSALERALFAYLGILGQQSPDTEVTGLIGWAGLHANAVRRDRPVPRPNGVPWDHLDLSNFTVTGPAPVDPATAQAQVEADLTAS